MATARKCAFAWLLSLCMAVSLTPLPAFADEAISDGGGVALQSEESEPGSAEKASQVFVVQVETLGAQEDDTAWIVDSKDSYSEGDVVVIGYQVSGTAHDGGLSLNGEAFEGGTSGTYEYTVSAADANEANVIVLNAEFMHSPSYADEATPLAAISSTITSNTTWNNGDSIGTSGVTIDATSNAITVVVNGTVNVSGQITVTGSNPVTIKGSSASSKLLLSANLNNASMVKVEPGGNLTMSSLILDGNKGSYRITNTAGSGTLAIANDASLVFVTATKDLQSSITLESGAVLTNSLTSNGTLHFSGQVYIRDGARITNNTSDGYLGMTVIGIQSFQTSATAPGGNPSVEMTGGEISGNVSKFTNAAGAGGIACSGRVAISGGSIVKNRAEKGSSKMAGGVLTMGTGVTISQNVVVLDNQATNTATGATYTSNVNVQTDDTFALDTLGSAADFGVYSQSTPTPSDDVLIATGGKMQDLKYMHSDNVAEAGLLYCDGAKDYSSSGAEVAGHHSSHVAGNVYLSVATNTAALSEAKIGASTYATIGEALAVAKTGDTVEIVLDTVTAVSDATLGKGVTLKDKAGNTYTPTVGAGSAQVDVATNGAVTLKEGGLDCSANAPITVSDGTKSHTVGSAKALTVSAGANGRVGTLATGESVVIDGITYTAAANNTSFPLVGGLSDAQVGTTASVPAGTDASVALGTSAIPIPVSVAKTNAGGVLVTKGDGKTEEGSVKVEKSGDTVSIGSAEYTTAANDTIITVGAQGTATLTAGAVDLDDNEAVILNGILVSNPASSRGDVVKVEKKGDGTATAAVPAGGSVEIDGVTYTNDGASDMVIVIGADGGVDLTGPATADIPANQSDIDINGKLYTTPADGGATVKIGTDGAASLSGGTVVLGTDAANKDIAVAGYVVTNPGPGNLTVVADPADSATISIPSGGNVSATKDSGTEDYRALADTTIVLGKDGKATITEGSVGLEGGKTIVSNGNEVGGVGSTAMTVTPDAAGNTTLHMAQGGEIAVNGKNYTTEGDTTIVVDKDGKFVLGSGSVTLPDDKALTVNGVTVENPAGSGGDEVKVTKNADKTTTATVPVGGIAVIGGVVFTNTSDKPLDIIIGIDGKVQANGSAKVEVPKDREIDLAGTGLTTPDSDAELSLADGNLTLTAGSVGIKDGGEVAVGTTVISNPADSADDVVSVTVAADGSADVEVPSGGRIGMGDSTYTATAEGAGFVLDSKGAASLATGSISLDADKTVATGGHEIKNTSGESVIVKSGDPNADKTTVAMPKGSSITVDGTKYVADEAMVLVINKDGNAVLDEGSVVIEPNKPVVADGNSIANEGTGEVVVTSDTPAGFTTVLVPSSGGVDINGTGFCRR